MIKITTQNDIKKVQDINFCYLCGKVLNPSDKINQDHVPPKSIFLKKDRDFPLKIPVHETCNSDQKIKDEQLALLIRLLHPEKEAKKIIKTELIAIQDMKGNKAGLIKGIEFHQMVFRILKGCMSTLYDIFIPYKTKNKFLTPLQTYDPKIQGPSKDNLLDQHFLLCKHIKENRKIDNIDIIEIYNKKFIFNSIWSNFDNGIPFCAFAMRIYEWEKLGHVLKNLQGCFGFIIPEINSIPRNASIMKNIDIPIKNFESLNPFEKQ